MGRYCLVPGCKSQSGQKGITLFVPKGETQSRQWMISAKREFESFSCNAKNSGVCSLHFTDDDFERDLKFELLNPTASPSENKCRKLKPDAVPSVSIPGKHPKETRPASSYFLKTRKGLDDVAMSEEAKKGPTGSNSDDPEPSKTSSDPEIRQLKLQVLELQEALALKNEEAERERSQAALYRTRLSELFTKQQVGVLLDKKRPCPWDEETVLKALAFRARLSQRQYDFLREAGLPLPSATTINSRLRQFAVRQGSADTSIDMLQRYLRDQPLRERLCIMMFDEMKMSSIMDYDGREDQVVGPHNNLQVVMLRSLVGNWRLPLFYDFDRAITADLLRDLVRQAESAGALVTGVVSDMGPTNQGLWTQLGIAHDKKTSFTNPADPNREVWVFADTPHLVKLARNHLLDKGIVLPAKGEVNRKFFQDILAIDAGHEFKLLPKVGVQSHVEVKGQGRQRVRPAFQLLSNSVATAAERFKGLHEEAEFIRVLDRGFDALNAQSPVDAKELRRGMSADSVVHQRALTDLDAAMRRYFKGKSSLIAFQKATIVTIASIRGLVRDVTALLGPGSYVLTGRVNQDPLESFFGLVRGKGGACLHPSPAETRCRVRNLTLMLTLRLGVNPLSKSATAAAAAASDVVVDAGGVDLDSSGDIDLAIMDGFLVDSATTDVQSDVREVQSLLTAAGQAPRLPVPAESPLDPVTGVSAEQYGLAHAAGYVSAKCRRIDPSLGTPSARVLDGEAAPVEALWTRLISQGGLSVPSAEWLARFREMEARFCAYHHLEPDGISRAPRVVETLVAQLAAERDALDTRVIRRFVRLRTFIRMSHVNRRFRAEAAQRREQRKRRQFAR